MQIVIDLGQLEHFGGIAIRRAGPADRIQWLQNGGIRRQGQAVAAEPALFLDIGHHQALHLGGIGHGRQGQIGDPAATLIFGLVGRVIARRGVLAFPQAGRFGVTGVDAVKGGL